MTMMMRAGSSGCSRVRSRSRTPTASTMFSLRRSLYTLLVVVLLGVSLLGQNAHAQVTGDDDGVEPPPECDDLTVKEAVRVGAWVGAAIGAGFFAAFLLAAVLFTCPCSGPFLEFTCTLVGCECCPTSCCADASDSSRSGDHHALPTAPNELGGDGTYPDGSSHKASVSSQPNGRALSTSLLHASYIDPEADSVVLVEPPGAEDDGSAGEFGAFLTLVEFLDAIPESMVLAEAVARGQIQFALIVSIVVLNFSTGFAMFSDLIRSNTSNIHGDNRVYQLLFVSATLAAGMLVFSVSDEVYTNFTEHEGDQRFLSLGLLIAGTIVGAALVLGLMWLSSAQAAATLKDKLWQFFACCSVTALTSGSSWITIVREGRVVKSLLLVIALTVWLIILTTIGVLIFRRNSVEKDFIEGFSGGAFIITIGGTLLPEAQHAAHKTHWSSTQKQIIAASSFLVGLILAVILKLLEDEEPDC
ncbi:hypothetical protein PTSG_08319 [Salpingoeca rosetta]|uniref:Uncharacterized protein n=1 Tax=Salpingoeca rosetta (strain ATCC 50818 / BSB-021) TaxID=946362 RepID=F2UJC7_SALR5|nr:uncharacterized protein PTSG_08319 [Salpingoeca rosetta]EGD77226.1 hypothetical protein PTSG_08319 [Salpingoeca rosetta]|eukprot:XP_004990570.1 hypothetical protein PTSG_08319 [Salpingoeca rosetta]